MSTNFTKEMMSWLDGVAPDSHRISTSDVFRMHGERVQGDSGPDRSRPGGLKIIVPVGEGRDDSIGERKAEETDPVD